MYKIMVKLNTQSPNMYQILTVNGEEYMAETLEEVKEKAKEILLEKEIEVLIGLNDGVESATAWGCDLTYDYVKINGDYRT